MRNIILSILTVLLLFAIQPEALPKVYIDIDSPAGRKLPVAIQEFVELRTIFSTAPGVDTEAIGEELMDALAGDLALTGFFDIIDKEAYLEDPDASGITRRDTDFSLWRAIGAELLVKGGIKVKGERLTVEFRLFDTIRGSELLAGRYVGRLNDPRRIAHRFADDLVEELTGKKGIFSTKLVFVSDRSGTKELYVSDYDGRNVRRVTYNGSINLSPRWSPDGRRILYTSYVNGRPCLYVKDLRSGVVRTVAARPGSNIAGRWSSDGSRIAFTASGKLSPEIFILELETGRYFQLTNNYSIDVSPAWSPDGSMLAFVSDRAGNPHIYVVDSGGGRPRRLTYKGKYNSTPAWSPDGRTIAFAGLNGSSFQIWTINVDGTGLRQLTHEGNNLSPSWSPDGRYIVFHREVRGGGSSLYIMRRDGSGVRAIDTGTGNETSPSWSPYIE